MSMLFYFDEQSQILLHPDVIKLCDEFTVLSEDETKAVILAYDYKGPYRQFSEPDRKRKALNHVYGTDEKNIFEKDKIARAVEAYLSMQYNPKVELARAYQTRIDTLQDEIISGNLSEKETTEKVKLINVLRKSISELESEVHDEVLKEGKIVGGGSISFLEERQKNREAYFRFIRNKKK